MSDVDKTSLRDELYNYLKADDRTLEFLLERVLDGVWYTDVREPRREWLSRGYKALFGYAEDEIDDFGEWWRRNMFPEDVQRADDDVRMALADPDHKYQHVVRFRHKDGHTVWVHCRGHVVRDAEGRPLRLLGCHIDVTRLMELEQIDRFGTIVEHCVSGIYLIDAETLKFVQANGGARQQLGYSMAELAELTPIDVSGIGSRQELMDRLAPLRDGKIPFVTFETTHIRKDGSTYPVEVHCEWLDTSPRPVFLTFVSDLSEMKRRENELAASREFNQIILDSVSDGIATLAPLESDGRVVDFTIIAVNHAMRRQFHLHETPFVGARLSEIMPGIAAPDLLQRLAEVASDGNAFAAEIGPGGATSDWHLVRANRTPFGALFITCINITAAKQRELSLRQSNEALKRFSAIVSHDLQAPLRHIGLFAEMLEAKLTGADDETRFMTGRIRDNTRRLQRMISGLLDYTTVAYAEIQRESVDLGGVVADVMKLLEGDIAAKQASIVVDPLPTVRGDRDLLARLFQNLIANALKYASDAPPRIVIGAKRPDGNWIISVADNGIGIDPRFGERIFDVFNRLHRDESRYPGMGIGLAICRQIVESHRGEIWVDSEFKPGARFCFSLPAD